MKFTLIPTLLCAAVPVFASPFISFWPNQLLPRTNSGPEVLYPHSGTVWQAGAVHNVTWSTEGLSPPTCGAVLNTAIYLAKNDAFEECECFVLFLWGLILTTYYFQWLQPTFHSAVDV